MLALEQIKFVEYLVTGHTIPEAAKEVGITAQTGRIWLKNPDILEELSKATDVFSKEVLKSRSRQYRVIQKKILDQIIKKIDENDLEKFDVMELIKMMDKSVFTARNDEDPKKVPLININQNTLNINGNIQDKFKQKEFADKFSELLIDMDPNDIEEVANAKERADKAAATK